MHCARNNILLNALVCMQYIMVELRSAVDGAAIPGYERSGCVFLNINSQRLPLRWGGRADTNIRTDGDASNATTLSAPPVPPAVGSKVFLRIFFRDATIFAFGVS